MKMGFFKSIFGGVSEKKIKFLIQMLQESLISSYPDASSLSEIIILSQYIPIRLAYQNNKSAEDLITIIKSDDLYVSSILLSYKKSISSFRSNRIKRFVEYETDWAFLIDRDSRALPFTLAKRRILPDSYNSIDVLPSWVGTMSILTVLQEQIGNLKYESDNWLTDFHPKLKSLY